MRLTAGPEDWHVFRPEVEQVIDRHWRELALNKDTIALEPRWDQYEARVRDGSIVVIVVRDAGRMIGYFVGFLGRHMHYASSLNLLCDLFYVLPEARRGFAGMRLFKAVEDEARRRGVQRIIVATKLHSDAGPLLQYMRYEAIETNYCKLLGA